MPDYLPGVGLIGNREGFTIRDRNGTVLREVPPLRPEENATWELGYKGLFGERLLFDVTAYYSIYQDFLSSLLPINLPARGEFAYYADGTRVEGANGPIMVLAYRDVGKATLAGTEIAVRYSPGSRTSLSGTLTWLNLQNVEGTAEDRAATALNSSKLRWSLSGTQSALNGRLSAGLLVRHAAGYEFVSGINDGTVADFTTLDVNARYHVTPRVQAYASVSDVFTCRGSAPAAARQDPGTATDSRCGFGVRHAEIVNMPAIGTALFVGLRLER
jgi:iron complex outermembrane receptor protein